MKNKTKLFAALLALTMLLALAAGCGTQAAPAETAAPADTAAPAETPVPEESETPAVPETRTVVDMDGNEVTVPYEITDCFNAYPVSNGIMTLLGVEAAQSYYLPRVSSGNWAWLRVFNPLINEKPQIGEDASVSAEELLTIAPQVVILSNAETAQTYRDAGLNVFSVRAKTTDEFLEAVIKTGELFGDAAKAKAEAWADYYRSNIELVAERIKDIPEADRPTVYYVGGKTPYNTSVKGNGLEFVTNAGGIFAAAEVLGDSREITAEQLLELDPDVIIVGTNNRAAGYDALMSDAALAALTAVKDGAVYKTPQGTLPWDTYGPEQAMAVLWMAKTLYPDLFEDIDLKAEMTDFYKTFYDYDLSDEYAELMLAGVMGPVA